MFQKRIDTLETASPAKREQRASRGQGRWNPRSGIATAEFALMLPVLMLFGLGVLQVAQMFVVQRQLLGAAHTGARTGSVQNSSTSQVDSAIATFLEDTEVGDAYEAQIVGVGPTATGDTLVTVTVTHDMPLFFSMPIEGWDGTTVPLSASVTLRHE